MYLSSMIRYKMWTFAAVLPTRVRLMTSSTCTVSEAAGEVKMDERDDRIKRVNLWTTQDL